METDGTTEAAEKSDISCVKDFVIPKSIAVIMDGNGRWAKKRALPVKLGHKAGAETLRKITDEAIALSVKDFTVFAFSTENWKRPAQEVNALMELMDSYLDQYAKDAREKNTRVKIIGDISRLNEKLREKIINIEEITKAKTQLNLNIAINYGGRDEILRAVKKVARAAAAGELSAYELNSMTEAGFSKYLDTARLTDPDLLIRTSGEMRISNFLLWQLAYTELYFTDKLWPDFEKQDLHDAIAAFNKKDRRFGGRNAKNRE